MTIRKWGAETLANTTTLGSQDQPAVASLANGGFVVMWHDQGPTDEVVRYQIYDALGKAVGGEKVSASLTEDQFAPSVVGLADGTFFFQQEDTDGANVDIGGAVRNSSGSLVRNQNAFDGNANLRDPDVATIGPFGTVAVWTDFDANAGNIVMRGFNNDGSQRFAAFTVNTNDGGTIAMQQSQAAVASSQNNGDIAVVWRDLGLNNGDIRCRVFDSSGAQVAAEFTINALTADLQQNPDVVWLDDNRFVVVWESETTTSTLGDGDDLAIAAVVYRKDGVALTGQFLVNSTTKGAQTSPAVVALSNGNFAVAWADASDTGLDPVMNSIRMQVFSSNGNRIGSETVINTTTNDDQTKPSLSVLADGRIVVSWEDGSQTGADTDQSAIRFQIVDPRDGIINGTGNNDTLYGHDGFADEFTGGDGDDTMHGLKGNDTFHGGVGKDTALGGLGDDVMFGGSGDDTLNGGRGVDEMDGGTGNDIIFVDNIDDTVIERAGEGTNDRVATNTSYVLGAGVQVELFTTTVSGGIFAIDLTGNSLAQTIVGNDGANVINDGGGAADELAGRSGNDTYQVAYAATTITEGSTQGTADRVEAAVDYVLAAGVYVEQLATDSSSGTSGVDLTGNVLKQSITGNAGANILHDGGAGAADTMTGLGGNDTYRVYNSGDVIAESSTQGTADRVSSAVDYKLGAGVYVEELTTNGSGGTSAIDLTGNEITQAITGNVGDNRLEGREGNDTLRGLAGNDTFVINTALGAGNVDTVLDFAAIDDRFLLSDTIFTTLSPGTLAAAAFRSNTTGAADDASDRIIYETDTGKLFYDADGNGATAGIHFATLTGAPAITNSDFVVV